MENMNKTLFAFFAALGLCAMSFAGVALAGPGPAIDPPQQTTPQGKDPPGPDNGAPETKPPGEHKDVIPPPDIGDEDIHADVPNPEAGHEEEVISPSDVPPQPEQQPPR